MHESAAHLPRSLQGAMPPRGDDDATRRVRRAPAQREHVLRAALVSALMTPWGRFWTLEVGGPHGSDNPGMDEPRTTLSNQITEIPTPKSFHNERGPLIFNNNALFLSTRYIYIIDRSRSLHSTFVNLLA